MLPDTTGVRIQRSYSHREEFMIDRLISRKLPLRAPQVSPELRSAMNQWLRYWNDGGFERHVDAVRADDLENGLATNQINPLCA